MNSSSQIHDGPNVISGGKLSKMYRVRLIGNQNTAAQSASGRAGGCARPLPPLALAAGKPLCFPLFFVVVVYAIFPLTDCKFAAH